MAENYIPSPHWIPFSYLFLFIYLFIYLFKKTQMNHDCTFKIVINHWRCCNALGTVCQDYNGGEKGWYCGILMNEDCLDHTEEQVCGTNGVTYRNTWVRDAAHNGCSRCCSASVSACGRWWWCCCYCWCHWCRRGCGYGCDCWCLSFLLVLLLMMMLLVPSSSLVVLISNG